MTTELVQLFEQLFNEYDFMEKTPENFPYKQSFLENSGLYVNVLSGKLSDGTIGSKTVYVNEYEGLLDAEIVMKVPGIKHLKRLDAGFLTVFRSGLVAAYVLWKSKKLDKKIGFIGGGKINLMTAQILSMMGCTDFVLIGGRYNVAKNEQWFSMVSDRKIETGFEKLKDCEVLVACTNNNDKSDLIRIKHAPRAQMVIAQDGGYTLASEWRNRNLNLSDYPKQLVHHFREEFPYDRGRFKNQVYQINLLRGDDNNIGVYLYGTIVADLIAAKFYIENREWFDTVFEKYYDALKRMEK